MIYLKNYKGKIYKNVVLIALENVAILKQIVYKEAQTIVSNIKENFKVYSGVDDIDKMKCHRIQQDIRENYITDDWTRIYFAYTENTATKKKRIAYINQKIFII